MYTLVPINTLIVQYCGVVPAYVYGVLNLCVFSSQSSSAPELVKGERTFHHVNIKKICDSYNISYSQFKRSINVLSDVGYIEFVTKPVLGEGTKFLFHILPIAN